MSSPQLEASPLVSGQTLPLVSIIIPCYNHGRYLREAIESVWQQAYPATEVVVVDDGSTDNTEEVAKQCGVTYLYQENQGLSAARNTGIRNSHGDLLVFLDADDWLLPGALEVNVRHLQQNEKLAFVSGGHDKVFVEDGITKEDITEVTSDHYAHLLQGNYIGMHATVMYRRWVFEEMEYDTSLKRCEDYDLYLRIAHKYPVLHHTEKIAAYRLHTANMSSNIPGMLSTVLEVLERQQDRLRTPAETKAYTQGQEIWKSYYCQELYQNLLRGKASFNFPAYLTLARHKPSLLLKFLRNRNATML